MPRGFRKGQGWYLSKLQGHGYRLTIAREAIVSVLGRSQKHLSVEEIFNEAKKIHDGIGLASIYRTLDLLVDLGFVHKLEFGEGKARYTLVNEKSELANHHHLICTRCGGIVDYAELLDEEKDLSKKTAIKLREQYSFEVHRQSVQHFGLCGRCKDAT
jgi:Fur family ferric uptake transcriptional regulator